MKVLVTGGLGFLGSHVCEHFAFKKHKVVSYDNMTKHELNRTGYDVSGCRDYNKNFLANLGVEIVNGDVCFDNDLYKAAKGCDYIVHTAAQPAITISVEDPQLDFWVNVKGTFNALEVAKRLSIPIAHCSTIHVYGNTRINNAITEAKDTYSMFPSRIGEDWPLASGNLTPLHASKIAADSWVRAYNYTYGMQAATFRLTGLYGPRQFGGEDHGWVANFCIRALLGLPITIYGNGKQCRDILYATDVAQAFEDFFFLGKGGAYNIGGPETVSLLQCINMIKEIKGTDIKVNFAEERIGDLKYFTSNYTKFSTETNWAPAVAPKDGIRRLLKWIQSNQKLFKRS